MAAVLGNSQRYNVKVIVNADAHRPEDLQGKTGEAFKIVKDLGNSITWMSTLWVNKHRIKQLPTEANRCRDFLVIHLQNSSSTPDPGQEPSTGTGFLVIRLQVLE